MPLLGADMEAGTLLEWRVAPGDTVRRGQIVALIDTDKAEIEVEIFEDGVVEELLVAPGRKVPVGTPLARLRGLGAAAVAPVAAVTPAPAVATAPPAAPTRPPASAPAPTSPPGAAGPSTRLRVTPLARRVAESLHVDLDAVHGTGDGGAITREDVERAAAEAPVDAAPGAAAPAAPEPSRAAERAASMRRTIAAAMARSKREIPHYYLATTIDLAAALRWLETENARRGVAERILPAALLLRATAQALREAPDLNGFFRDGRFEPSASIHVGVAISLRGGGLVAPALHDADRLSLDALMARLRDLVQRARAGVLRGSEVADPTITVTNLGDQGVELVFPVITPPQVAIVGFGKIVERPWAEEGLLGVRPTVCATLAADHRVSDGHRGARFLAALERRLAAPEAT
jgi:pyruvate dehydrogenase E2 component (dihydrolipoamide acetyltransferase)